VLHPHIAAEIPRREGSSGDQARMILQERERLAELDLAELADAEA
jgi:hypothetical protein